MKVNTIILLIKALVSLVLDSDMPREDKREALRHMSYEVDRGLYFLDKEL